MSTKSVKDLLLKYFKIRDLIYRAEIISLPSFMGLDEKLALPAIESMMNRASTLGLRSAHFKKLLESSLLAKKHDGAPIEKLNHYIKARCKLILNEIKKTPKSVDKAMDALRATVEADTDYLSDSIYDVLIFFRKEIPEADIWKILDDWKHSYEQHKQRAKTESYHLSKKFWVSRDFMDTFDGICRYRFHEVFEAGEFDDVFSELESELAAFILENTSSMEIFRHTQYSKVEVHFAFDLWLMSRSKRLATRLSKYINIALEQIVWAQTPEGNWRSSTHTHGEPDLYVTALCSVILLKLAQTDAQRESGELSARWLMNQQNSDGSWNDFEGGKVVRGTFVSLLCLEAISRSNLQKINRTRQRGIDWIISQQDNFGFWNETGLPYIFFTTIVLEYLQSKDSYPQIHDPYLSMAKSFLSNGSQFSAESDSNLQRLAITISFQGMEAFLYAILSHPSVNEKIFDKPGETIGMKKALTTFQGNLQKNKVLNSSQVIDYRNSLDRLAYLRDEVVHKGIDILPHTSQPLIEDALRFSSKYSLHVFGFDIWK